MPGFYYTLLMIITAADQAACNAAAAQLTGNPADAMTFTVGLSPTGMAPATHFWANTQANDSYRDAILQLAQAFPDSVVIEWNMDAAPNTPAETLSTMGLQVINESGL